MSNPTVLDYFTNTTSPKGIATPHLGISNTFGLSVNPNRKPWPNQPQAQWTYKNVAPMQPPQDFNIGQTGLESSKAAIKLGFAGYDRIIITYFGVGEYSVQKQQLPMFY